MERITIKFCGNKKQTVIGLWSEELSGYIMCRTHLNKDDLFQDIIE